MDFSEMKPGDTFWFIDCHVATKYVVTKDHGNHYDVEILEIHRRELWDRRN